MPFTRVLALLIALGFPVIYIAFPEFAYSEIGDALVNKAIVVYGVLMVLILLGKVAKGTYNEDETTSYSFGGKVFALIVLSIVVYGFFHFLLKVDPLGVM
jgi:hypothetical protein